MSGSSHTRGAGTLALSLFAGLMVVASPARTDIIPSGIDVWHTAQGSGTTIDIPAGMLGCGHSKLTVAAHGVPVATTPSGELGQSDTVLYRPNAVSVPRGGSAGTALRIVALNLEGDTTVSACGQTWNVSASLGGRSQPTSTISIALHSSGLGGTYTTSFDVDAVIQATSGSTTKTANAAPVTISTASPSNWAFHPGDGGVEGDPSAVDTDGDGTPDTDFPSTASFAPGWQCDDFVSCDFPNPSPPDHDGPHGVDPPTGC